MSGCCDGNGVCRDGDGDGNDNDNDACGIGGGSCKSCDIVCFAYDCFP